MIILVVSLGSNVNTWCPGGKWSLLLSLEVPISCMQISNSLVCLKLTFAAEAGLNAKEAPVAVLKGTLKVKCISGEVSHSDLNPFGKEPQMPGVWHINTGPGRGRDTKKDSGPDSLLPYTRCLKSWYPIFRLFCTSDFDTRFS